MKAEMKKWIKRGMALILTGMVILSGAGIDKMTVQATKTPEIEQGDEEEESGKATDKPGSEQGDEEKESGKADNSNQEPQVIIKEVEVEVDRGPSSTSEFLTLSDTFQTPTVTHGERVVIGLPVVNYSTVPLNDVVVRPRISNLVSEWPFEPNAAGATKTIKQFPAYDNKKNIEDARQELGFAFVVREDVKSGYYKLEFDVTYLRNGQVEKGVLTTYVYAVGTDESGFLEGQGKVPSSTNEFLSLSSAWQTPTIKYGQNMTLMLPVVNYSTVSLSDVIVKPKISNLVSEWPFEPNSAEATKAIRSFPAYDNTKDIENVRQDVGFNFKVRDDVKSGYYKLEFDVTYLRAGQVEKGTLTTYVKAVGKPESGSLDGQSGENAQTSKPRIIVTGFETDPAQVFAGETFTLTIHVKNTSQSASVTNVLFDMQAKEEGKDEDSKFAAFLPTSGSSSVYVDSLAPGMSKDLVIEMSAKSDLSQKPYVLDVNMKYDAKEAADLTDKASVSIPIYQEQRCETGDAEVMPTSITVGGQTNIMFDVYNTGKTTLYNVWVKFEGDSITGGDSFLGTIASGATGGVDAMVTGAAPTMDDGKIKAIVSFENESGVVTTVEKELELFVSEEMTEDFFDPSMGMEGEMDMEEMQGGGKNFVLPVVIVVIIVLVAVVVVVVRKRKKKKEQAELEADLKALDDVEK